MLNSKAETKIGTILMIALILGAIAYVTDFGGFEGTVDNFLGKSSTTTQTQNQGTAQLPVLTDTKDCPTDGTTTYTINVQDALTTTATSLYPEYYIFNGQQLIKEGTLSSTANTVSVSCGKDYQMLLVNTTATSGMYAKTVDLKARIAQQTLNEKMINFGDGKIYNIVNPLDKAGTAISNISFNVASTEKNFDIQFGANRTQKGFNKPIIMCQANTTEVTGIKCSSYDRAAGTPKEVSTPKRISALAGFTYYAWEYPDMMTMADGPETIHCTIKSGATAPAQTSSFICIMADQATWKIAQYKSATSIEEGFKTGAENTETYADVGALDAAAKNMTFSHSEGV